MRHQSPSIKIQAMTFQAVTLLLLIGLSPLSRADTLASADKEIDEVVVSGRRESDYSLITERAQKIIDVPGSLGDPLLAAFSLPGVLAVSEGGAPAVRGSSPSDNRYVVDGAPAGYIFHSFSTSVFNENIIQDFELYSAGFGPNYSNAIGGVFDITLRDPKQQPFTTKLDVGILRAGIFFEGGVTENSAFYLSARGSLLHLFIGDKAKKEAEKEDGIRIQQVPRDTDYQFKYVYDLNEHNSLKFSANGATDLAEADFTNTSDLINENPDFTGDAKIDNNYQNAMATWKSTHDGSDFVLQLGQYVNNNDLAWGDKQYFFKIKNTDSYLVSHYDFVVQENHNLSVGGEAHKTRYTYDGRFTNYVCTETDPDCIFRRGELLETKEDLHVNENMVYVNDHWQVTDKVAIDLGVQVQHNDYTEETFTSPRLAMSWELVEDWSVNSSLGQYNRFPELDKILPSVGNPELKSPTSNHFTLGVKHKIDNGWSWSATSYYKTIDHLPLAMAANIKPVYTNNVEGEAYGLDIFVNKEMTDRWYGWLAISLSKSVRTNQLTQVESNYYLDTPVVINWVMNYKLTDLWTAGMRLTAQTGRAYTPIIGAQTNPYVANKLLPVYGEAFSENLPSYSRLDLRFKRDTTFFGYKGNINIDILNALNIKNVTDRHLDYKRTTTTQDYKIEDDVGLGIIPAIGMSVTF
jgi:hypothetical protein